jgi:hypothetical protein
MAKLYTGCFGGGHYERKRERERKKALFVL